MSTMGPMLKTDILHDPSSFFQTEWGPAGLRSSLINSDRRWTRREISLLVFNNVGSLSTSFAFFLIILLRGALSTSLALV